MKQECYGGNVVLYLIILILFRRYNKYYSYILNHVLQDNEKSAYILIYEKEIQQNLQLSIVHNEDNKNDEQNQNM